MYQILFDFLLDHLTKRIFYLSLLLLICAVTYLINSLQEQCTHVALAFEVPGGWRKEKEAVLLTVLQVLHLK